MALAGILSFSKEEISVSLIAYLLAICFQVGSLGRLFLLSKSITARLVSASSSCNPLNPNETPGNQVNSRLKQQIIIKSRLSFIVWVNVVLNRTVVVDSD